MITWTGQVLDILAMSSAYLTFFSCLAASRRQSHVTVISNRITDGLK